MDEVLISKCRVGPVTELYQDGSYQAVEEDDERRVGMASLKGEHNKDIKLGYVSDPVIMCAGDAGMSYDELERALRTLGVWSLASFSRVEVMKGGSWVPAFKSLPKDASLFEQMYTQCKESVGEMDFLGDKSKNECMVFVK